MEDPGDDDYDHAHTSIASETGTSWEVGVDSGHHVAREAEADHTWVDSSLLHAGAGDNNLRVLDTSPSYSLAASVGALALTSGTREAEIRSFRDAGDGSQTPSSQLTWAQTPPSHANVHLASNHELVLSLCLNTACHLVSLTAR